MSVEQDTTTQQGAQEAKENRKRQEEGEKLKQREFNAARPHSPEEDRQETSGEPRIVRCVCCYLQK